MSAGRVWVDPALRIEVVGLPSVGHGAVQMITRLDGYTVQLNMRSEVRRWLIAALQEHEPEETRT